MRKKVDGRVRALIEAGVASGHRSLIVLVGDGGREQVCNLHYMLSKAQVRATHYGARRAGAPSSRAEGARRDARNGARNAEGGPGTRGGVLCAGSARGRPGRTRRLPARQRSRDGSVRTPTRVLAAAAATCARDVSAPRRCARGRQCSGATRRSWASPRTARSAWPSSRRRPRGGRRRPARTPPPPTARARPTPSSCSSRRRRSRTPTTRYEPRTRGTGATLRAVAVARRPGARGAARGGLALPSPPTPSPLYPHPFPPAACAVSSPAPQDSARVLGRTFGMCVLQDFEALTPNVLARAVETVAGGTRGRRA